MVVAVRSDEEGEGLKKNRENGAGEAEEERRGDFLNRAGVVEWSGG